MRGKRLLDRRIVFGTLVCTESLCRVQLSVLKSRKSVHRIAFGKTCDMTNALLKAIPKNNRRQRQTLCRKRANVAAVRSIADTRQINRARQSALV